MRLTTKEITYLKNLFPKGNKLGLFVNINDTPLGGEKESLEIKGILSGGLLTPEGEKSLTPISAPERCTRLILNDGICMVEKYSYRLGADVVLAENDGGEMLFSSPEDFSDTVMEISEFVGLSSIKSMDFEANLNADEAVVFFAMMDVYRRRAILGYLGEKTEEPPLLEAVKNQINGPDQNSLVKTLIANYGFEVPSAEKIQPILNKLAENNLEILSANFLIPESYIMLETFNLGEKEDIYSMGMLCICAGVKNILAVSFLEDGLEILTINGLQLIKIIEDFLGCPKL